MRTRRTIGLIVLTCVLGGFAFLAGLIVWLGALRGIVLALIAAAVAIGVYLIVIGPWQRRWGATDEEVGRTMPGDELLRPVAPRTTRAITIDARPEEVFPWLLQIGYGRGGWYSYDWIDNDGRPSVERIDPALQRLVVGDRIEMFPGFGPVVREIEPDHHIVSAGQADAWCLLVEPTSDGRTRLISRWRQELAEDGRHVYLDRARRPRSFSDGAEDASDDSGPSRATAAGSAGRLAERDGGRPGRCRLMARRSSERGGTV